MPCIISYKGSSMYYTQHSRFWIVPLVLLLCLCVGEYTATALAQQKTYQRVPFKTLRLYSPGSKVPERIRALDGQYVEILGFMSALTQLEDINEFVLASSPPMNCFCHPPLRINEMLLVHMRKGITTEFKAGVVKIRGKLTVNMNVTDEFADVMYTVECDEVL